MTWLSVVAVVAQAAPLEPPTVLAAAPKNPALTRASRQIDEGDFEDAVKTVEKALNQPDLTDAELVELYRVLGLAHLYLGNEAKAQQAIEKLLQAQPDYELPKSSPPKVRALFAQVRDDVRQRRVRQVTLQVDEPAEVTGGAPLTVTARVDDMPLGAKAKLFYRRAGAPSFSSVDFVHEKGSTAYLATIPAFELSAGEGGGDLEYYVEVTDTAQRRLAGRGDPYAPLAVAVRAKVVPVVPPAPPVARPWYQNPWVWVGIGAGAAAIATGAVLLTSQQTASLPITVQVEGTP